MHQNTSFLVEAEVSPWDFGRRSWAGAQGCAGWALLSGNHNKPQIQKWSHWLENGVF